jgi:Fe2+ or Zn2+ uptake regulation protein
VPDNRITEMRTDRIYKMIREAGGRLTVPTRAVVDLLVGDQRHFTADDLIAEIGRRTPGISPSTIYRVLQRLDELGVIEHVHPGVGAAFYHLREDGHSHLLCNSCGRIIDVPDEVFAGLSHTVDETYSFAVEPHHAALLGRCRSCRAADGQTANY